MSTRTTRNSARLLARKYDTDGGIAQRVRIMCKAMSEHAPASDSKLASVKLLRQATRLWNWIDHVGPGEVQPESLWEIMRTECRWAFGDYRDTNSIMFTY